MNRISIFIISVIVMSFGGSAWAQLTISSAAQSGTVSSSGSNPVTISATGAANISTATIEGYLNNDISVIIASNGSVTLSNPISKSTGAAASLTLRAANGDMNINANIVSTSNALNLVLWTNFSSTAGAGLQIANATINTNGGHLYAGGGATTETLNSLTVPTGYANSNTTGNNHGIAIVSCNINSNGGEIRMKGSRSAAEGVNTGLHIYGTTTISSGAGNLSFYGLRTGDPFAGAGLFIGTNINNPSSTVGTGNVSISSTSGNIYMEGTTASITGAHAWNHGFCIVMYHGDDVSITSSTGNITFYGDGTSSATQTGEAVGFIIQSNSTLGLTNISTDGGNITITGKSSDAGNNLGVGLRANAAAGNITIGDANTGNVTLRFGSLQTTVPGTNVAGRIALGGAGACLLEGISSGAFAAAVDVTTAYAFGSTFSSLQIGSANNNQSVTLSAPSTVNGPLSIYGSSATIQGNVALTLSAAKLLAKATGNISLSANVTTNNGDVILWSDSDNNNAGSITLADNITVNSANGSTASNLTGGGNIVFAGGADNGANSGTANDNIPDNYAQSSNGLGLSLGTTEANLTQCYSGGGNIILNGKSTFTGGGSMERIGVMQNGKFIANAGNGSIIINGSSSGFYAINFVFLNGASVNDPTYLTLISNKSTGNAIQISGTSVNNYGIVFNYNSPKQVLATGGGNIQMTGVAGANNGIFLQNVNLLATSGDINLDGGTLGIKIPSGGARFGAVSGTSITSSSSNIKFIGNAISIDDPNPVFSSTGFSTSGTITIEPKSTSFSSAFTWPSYLTTTSATSGLTIGKLNNTADIAINAAQNINGPITIYGGALSGSGVLSLASGNNLSLNLSSNSTYGGAINGTNANLIKAGAGALTLSAACGYTGSTTVNGGTLQFNENKAFNAISIANGATLALGPNKQFDFNSTFANNGTLNLKSGATILHGGSNTISGTGSYVVEQAITGSNSGGTPNGRFWYLGSPVTSVSSSVFFGNTANVLKKRNETNNSWVAITNAAPENLEVGKGYYTQATASSTISFSGSALNNGAISISGLTRTAGQNFEGFNLVSNPYPSYLDWDAVTKTDVGNTMWYRTASGSTAGSMVFDTYVAGTGGIGTNLNGAGVSNLIPPMQSFWVRVNSGSTTGSLALTNSMRAHFTSINGSTAGLKSTSNERDLFLRMNLLQADKKDQLIVYVNDNATNGFDILDGEKMMQAGMPQFYTTAAGKKITINGLNSAKKQQALPITMELPTTGVHSFVIEDLEISNGLVWLEDKQEEIMQALEPGTVYEFYANSGVNAERFVLHFQLIDNTTPINVYNEVNGSANFSGKGASVHAESAGVVVIKLPATTEGVTDIQIRDAAGRLVYTGATNTLETSVQLAQANGIYYVTLNSNSGVEVRKVFVQQ